MSATADSPGTERQLTFLEQNATAENLIAEGKLIEAARVLVGIAEKDSSNYRAYNNMGIIAWIQQAWNDAYDMFKKSVSIRPDYPDALMNLFDAALKLRKVETVLPDFEKALAADPGLEEVAVLITAIKEEGQKIYQSERALKVGVHNPLLEEANRLLQEGKLYPAMDKFLEMNDTQGPSAEAFNGLGVISYYQKRFTDAFTLFVESIKLNPNDPDTFMNLLDASLEIGHAKKAIEIYKLFASKAPALKSVAEEFEKAEAGTYMPGK
jgi:tetratricopeptide (TPR) repeat protein